MCYTLYIFFTAWSHIMVQTSTWHKPDDKIFKIFNNVWLSSAILVYIHIPSKEVDMLRAINKFIKMP